MQKTLLVINGPTGVGKTALSIQLAKTLNTEIISTDSRQFFREMNIGTAKPTPDELNQIKHHFINNQSIHDLYSAGDFEKEAIECLTKIFKNKEIVIAIGGSGLYIKALCEGLDEMPPADMQLRNWLITNFNEKGISFLQNELLKLDNTRFELIDKQNPQRLMRAIEMANQKILLTQPKKTRDFKIIKIGIECEKEELYLRINTRVDDMMQMGLLEEVKFLYPFKELNALKTVGYSELFDYLDQKISLDKAIELIKQHTRNYAKRQLTWFRKDLEINWFKKEAIHQIINLATT